MCMHAGVTGEVCWTGTHACVTGDSGVLSVYVHACVCDW